MCVFTQNARRILEAEGQKLTKCSVWSSTLVNGDMQMCARQWRAVLTVPTFEGTESQRIHNSGRYRSLIAALHHSELMVSSPAIAVHQAALRVFSISAPTITHGRANVTLWCDCCFRLQPAGNEGSMKTVNRRKNSGRLCQKVKTTTTTNNPPPNSKAH